MSKRIINYPTITSVSADDFLLLANYNNELGKRKLLASKLVPSGEDLIGSSSDWTIHHIENNASISWINNQIIATWNGSYGYAGINIYKNVKIPANARKIKFKIATGVNGRDWANDALTVGLMFSIPSGWYQLGDMIVRKSYGSNYQNSNIIDELDLSNIHSDAYLCISSVMWNYTVTQLELF